MTGKTDVKRKPRRRRRAGSIRRRFLLGFALMLCLAIAGTAVALYTQMENTLDRVTDDPYRLPDEETPAPEEYESAKPLSVIIIGTDTRERIGTLNTDVLMVAAINPKTDKVTMVSLPRDTRIKIPGYPGYHKINEVFALGEGIRERAEAQGKPVTENGVTLLKKTVESMLGIPIHHYVLVDFQGFRTIIDELGGIEVDVDRDLYYNDPRDGTRIALKKGRQVLNGDQALGYVRHRLDNRGPQYYSSDFDRNRRQQQVLRAVIDKATSLQGAVSVFGILDAVGNHVRTDFTKDQIKGLASDFKDFSSSGLVTLDNGALWDSRLSYTLWPLEKMQAVRAALQQEMGVTSPDDLNNAAVAEYARTETAMPAPSKKNPAEEPQPQPSAKPRTGGTTNGASQPDGRTGDNPPADATNPGNGTQLPGGGNQPETPGEGGPTQPGDGSMPPNGNQPQEPGPDTRPPDIPLPEPDLPPPTAASRVPNAA